MYPIPLPCAAGHKVWTSYSDVADWCILLARTDADVPKHRGLTMCIVPLAQPGIDIEPIMQANGEAEFCQEFLTDVRPPRCVSRIGVERRVAGLTRRSRGGRMNPAR